MPHKIEKGVVIEQIREIQPDIIIIGDYTSKASPLRVRCAVCNFEWDSTANRLLAGHGCRKCAGVRKRHKRGYYKKTHEQFVKDLMLANPDISLCSEYVTAKDMVDCSCKKCGNVWSAKAANLLSGFGCPRCAVKSNSAKQIKPNSVFVSEMAVIHPEIKVIGEYSGNKNNVRLACNNCGFEWSAMPINLLRKDGKATGCPNCRRSHGEAAVANWLESNGMCYQRSKTFDGLLGVGDRPLSYDFFLANYNLLIEFQGQYHDNTARIQTDNGFLKQSEHDRRKREYAKRNGISLLEIWYYEDIEEKLINTFNNIKEPVTTTAS